MDYKNYIQHKEKKIKEGKKEGRNEVQSFYHTRTPSREEKMKGLQDAMARSKQEALNRSVDKKYDAINKSKGLTSSGKRKWHYYNSKI